MADWEEYNDWGDGRVDYSRTFMNGDFLVIRELGTIGGDDYGFSLALYSSGFMPVPVARVTLDWRTDELRDFTIRDGSLLLKYAKDLRNDDGSMPGLMDVGINKLVEVLSGEMEIERDTLGAELASMCYAGGNYWSPLSLKNITDEMGKKRSFSLDA